MPITVLGPEVHAGQQVGEARSTVADREHGSSDWSLLSPPGQRTDNSAGALLLFAEDGDVVDLLALCVCTGRCIG